VTVWHSGFKFGEFARTRQRAIFRIKTLRKKKKTKKKLGAARAKDKED
jgi:ribosomal protein S19